MKIKFNRMIASFVSLFLSNFGDNDLVAALSSAVTLYSNGFESP